MNQIPSISQLYQLILQDYQNQLGTNIPSWAKTIVRTFSAVYAAIVYSLYLRMNFVYRNMLPDTADSTADGGTLQRWGLLLLNRLPYSATQGRYIISGVGANGSTIPSGRQFTSSRNNTIFVNDTDFVFAPGQQSFEIRALTAGTSSRLSPGDTITIVSPVTGVENTFTVIMEMFEPTDAEPLESYREKLTFAFRYRSRGGAAVDYRFWGQQVTGVRQVYPYTGAPLPNVNLYVESETNNGIPSQALLNSLQAYVDVRRPLGIYCHYLPVQPINISITINGGQSLTASDRIAIESSVATYLKQKRPYIEAVDGSNRNDVVYVNEVISLIQSLLPGVILGNINMYINGAIYPSYMLDMGRIPLLTQINYN